MKRFGWRARDSGEIGQESCFAEVCEINNHEPAGSIGQQRVRCSTKLSAAYNFPFLGTSHQANALIRIMRYLCPHGRLGYSSVPNLMATLRLLTRVDAFAVPIGDVDCSGRVGLGALFPDLQELVKPIDKPAAQGSVDCRYDVAVKANQGNINCKKQSEPHCLKKDEKGNWPQV